MPADNPRFVPELNVPEKPSRYMRALSAVRSRLGISRYQENFGEMIYPAEDGQEFSYPTKAVLKDGLLLATTSLLNYWQPKEFIDPLYVPGFAVGNCVNISNGDYKTVLIDRGGQSDTVIKRYQVHTYWGSNAEDRAEAAKSKLDKMYAVMEDICPQLLLPTERFVYPMPYIFRNEEGWGVFERQQRALFTSPWLCEEPKIAEEIVEAQMRLSNRYHKKIASALIKAGICKRASYSRSVALEELCFGVAYDARTRSLREHDIIDYLHADAESIKKGLVF